jgi:hypothetical protein
VNVEQDPDQSPEGCLSACADEGKPRFNHWPVCLLSIFWIYHCYLMCIYVQELIETLVAWSLITNDLLLEC